VEVVVRGGIFAVGVCGAADLVRVGRKVAVQNIQKSSPAGLVERLIYSQNFLCQMSARNSAAFRQQGVTKRRKFANGTAV
jgi:hypothetical protein